MARVAAVKIIAYKGVPDRSIALGIALYKRVKRVGGKKTIISGFDLITVKYTATKKEIRIVLRATFVIEDLAKPYAPSVGAQQYSISSLSGSSAEPANADVAVTPVNSAAIFTQSSVSLSALDAATNPTVSIFLSTALGQSLSVSARIAYVTAYLNTLIQGDRNEELKYMIGGNLTFSTNVYLSPSSAVYQAGKTVAQIASDYNNMFLGTDASGNTVVLCRIQAPWVDGEAELVLDYPLLYNYSNDVLIGTTNQEYRKAKYYTEHFAIIPLDVFIHKTCVDYLEQRAYEETGISNSVDAPDVVINYAIGGNEYTLTILQSTLQAVDMSGDWEIADTIPAGTIPPAITDAQYKLTGNGSTVDSGITVISGAQFVVQVDDVGVADTYETVYLPSYMPESEWTFCTGSNNEAIGDISALHSGVTNGYSGSSNADYDFVWLGVHARVRGMEYDIALHTNTVGGETILPIDFSVNVSNTYNVAHVVSYERGQVVVTDELAGTTGFSTGVTTGLRVSTGLEGDISTPLPGTTTESSGISGSIYTDPAEQFIYDDVSYSYEGPYYQTGAMQQNYTYYKDIFPAGWPGTPQEYETISNSGLEQDRAARTWYHNPLDATYTEYIKKNTSLVVMNGSSYDTVHIHTVKSAVSGKQSRIYFNGGLLGSVDDNEGTPVAIDYRHELSSKMAEITLTSQYTESCVVCSGTFADRTSTLTENMSTSFYTHNGAYQMIGYLLSTNFGATNIVANSYRRVYLMDDAYLQGGASNGRHHPMIDYDQSWFTYTPANPDIYGNIGWGAVDTTDVQAGYSVFPITHSASTQSAVIHWRGAKDGVDGLCVMTYSVTAAVYATLLDTYIEARSVGEQAAIDVAAAAVDSTITVLHNNFASPQLMRYFIPNKQYTIFK